MSTRLLLGLCVGLCTLGQTQAWGETLRRIVVFQEGTPMAVQTAIVRESGSILLQALPLINALVINLPARGTQEASTSLKSHPEVIEIHVDAAISAESLHSIRGMQGIPRARGNGSTVSGSSNACSRFQDSAIPWNFRQIRLDRVSGKATGENVRIALLDTGIDYTHPDLSSRVVGCYNARAGEDPTDCMDRNGHGTHIGGIIASTEYNNPPVNLPIQLAGIARETQLVAVKVLDDAGGGFVSDLINGLSWVASQKGIRVVNMSLAFYKDVSLLPYLQKVVRILYKSRVTMVAAAGNYKSIIEPSADGTSLETFLCVPQDPTAVVASGEGGEALLTGAANDNVTLRIDPTCNGRVKFPARYPETIAVSATDIDGNIAYYSIKGEEVDITAPGGTRQNPILSTTTRHRVISPTSTCIGSANPVAAGEGGECTRIPVAASASAAGIVDLTIAGEGGESIIDLIIAGEGGEGEGGESLSGFGQGSGTSQATAHVTGTIALMLAENPRLSPDDIRMILQITATDLGVSRLSEGAGLLDAARAIRLADDWQD